MQKNIKSCHSKMWYSDLEVFQKGKNKAYVKEVINQSEYGCKM
jgi:hypothetical protein